MFDNATHPGLRPPLSERGWAAASRVLSTIIKCNLLTAVQLIDRCRAIPSRRGVPRSGGVCRIVRCVLIWAVKTDSEVKVKVKVKVMVKVMVRIRPSQKSDAAKSMRKYCKIGVVFVSWWWCVCVVLMQCLCWSGLPSESNANIRIFSGKTKRNRDYFWL